MAGCISGLTVCHTASLIAEKHKANNSNHQPTVYACVSDRTNVQREELQQAVAAMGCKSMHKMDASLSAVSVCDFVWETEEEIDRERWKQRIQQSVYCLCLRLSLSL